jgi:DNA-binding NarL/FixJ family response regulator
MNIMIADRAGIFREGLKSLINRLAPHKTCFEIESLDCMYDMLLERHDIGLLILNLDLVGTTRFDDLARLRHRWPALRVVLLTRDQDILTVREAFALGVAGYLLRNETTSVYEQAFRLILAGGVFISERLIREPMIDRDSHSNAGLTPRQQQVLELVANGLSNKEIGRMLELAEGTVKAHVAALLKSIGVRNRTQAANWARDQRFC